MQNFISNSEILKEIKNSADLLKHLDVNVLIKGEIAVGKKTLALYIKENAKIYNAKILQNDISDKVININNTTIIIDRIDEITNVDLLIFWINENNIRVIAISTKNELNNSLENIFSITLEIPPLQKREEDINALAKQFSKEALDILGQDSKPKKLILNTKENAHSLRKSIFFSHLFESIGEEEIMALMQIYISDNMQGENSYKDFLHLLEVPLLKASASKHKSQVQMAKHLGLNRITLRKKLQNYKELL